jgi:alpha-L-rhamnosidase
MRVSKTLVFTCLSLLFSINDSKAQTDISPLTRQFISPVRIVWKQGHVRNGEQLLQPGRGQAVLANTSECVMYNDTTGPKASILLDFGRELHGGLEIITGMFPGGKPLHAHLCFGESVSEAMSQVGKSGATNDHAMRDYPIQFPWLGKIQVGETGFRFVRIDLEDNASLSLKEVRAIFTYRNIPYLGSFKSNDERLNTIWKTGAYTVHLNMQEYLWDGIKRDRLVWVGDLHPEVSTINAVFGYNEVVPKSLDLVRDITPLPGWMNGISTYSMWWIILQHDWYMNNGDYKYLAQQKTYLAGLVRQIISKVDSQHHENMDGNRFLDWPSNNDPQAIHAGLQAMTIWSLSTAATLCKILGDKETGELCNETVKRMKTYIPDAHHSKQAAALMVIAGLMPADKANDDILSVGGAANFSTFYGYYMLTAMAQDGKYQDALDRIRQYWGGMLDVGATTFWEDFNVEWLKNAARIDELVPPGKTDIHGNYGDYCYKGFRHSLSHGWSSGPTAWLSRYVLGVEPLEPGCKKVRITPHLGDLTWVEGTYPTPYGNIVIRHEKRADGTVSSKIKAPKEVKIIKD